MSLPVPADYEEWMRRAVADARLAFDTGDVPVAALVIDENAVDEGLRAWSAAVEAGVSGR